MGNDPTTSAAQRYPWRVRCTGCGWIDHFDTEATAQEWADRHNASTTSWPHNATVSERGEASVTPSEMGWIR